MKEWLLINSLLKVTRRKLRVANLKLDVVAFNENDDFLLVLD